MKAVIQQLHDGITTRVRPDDGVCSVWFAVDQSLRQRCVLSPLLFDIFAAVLIAVLQKFSEDTVILVILVHVKEPPALMGLESAMDCVPRPTWGMLYVDVSA